MTGVPSDLESLKEDLIEAVINAYMLKEVTRDSPFDMDTGADKNSCADGEFRYKQDVSFGADYHIYCHYPSGKWEEDVSWSPDADVDQGDKVGDLQAFDAVSKWNEIREYVSGWIDPWIASFDPTVLGGPISSLAAIVDQLYVTDEVRVENPVTGQADPNGSDKGHSVPVADVASAIADMRSELSSLQGLAIDALEASYTNDVALTISGQRALAAVAAIAIAGEGEAWYQTYKNLVQFFGNATKDFNSFAQAHGASGQGAQTALSAVSGVTAVAGAASAEFPPAALALGVVSGLAGIGATFYPTEEAVPDVRIQVTGGSYQAMLSKFEECIRAVDSQLTTAEYNLSRMCQKAIDSYYSNPDAYSITSVGRATLTTSAPVDPQPGDDLGRFQHTDQNSPGRELYAGDPIYIVHNKLRATSGMIEHVGDHQREVAGHIGTDLTSSRWDRPTLQGVVIGWGPQGHHGYYQSVLDELTDLLLMEAKTAHGVAEHCWDIATGFSKTDSEIAAGLKRLEAGMYPG